MDLDLAAIDPIWFAVAAGVLVLVIVAIVVAVVRSRRRRAQLQDRYGPEYRRAVDEAGSRRAADRALIDREQRRQSFELRPLDQDERDRFRARWEDLQSSFVDGPADAVRRADTLIDDVADKVGYPKASREQRLADLSVDHPASVDEYRKGRPASTDAERGPTTEQLRQALLTSRSLFEAVVGRDTEDVGIPPAPFRELEGTGGAERANGHRAPGSSGQGGEPDAGGADRTEEVDLRERDLPEPEPAADTHTSPVLGPDGRPFEADDEGHPVPRDER
jgi:hypothetical protein